MNELYIVGTGPGSPEYLTEQAKRAISEARIVVGWEFNFQPVRSITSGKRVFLQDAKNYLQVAEEAAVEARKTGFPVAVLRVGDPCISSGLAGLQEIFHDFEIKIIPGISSVQMGAALAQINIDDSVIISFHETGVEEKRNFMVDAYRRNRHLILLTGPEQVPGQTASYLIEHGVNPSAEAIVCESISLPEEKISRGTLADIAGQQFSWLSLMVVKAKRSNI